MLSISDIRLIRYIAKLSNGTWRLDNFYQRGQVMPMTLVFMVAVILGLWVMYDSGVVMGEKIRLQNTTDSVAYSTATLVARDLNFIAYTNRGMMANQAAIGQMVGLSAWAALIEQFAMNADNVASFFPPARVVTTGIKQGATATADAIDQFAEAMIEFNEFFIDAMSISQQGFHGVTVLAVAEFGAEIAERNDPNANARLSSGDNSFAEPAALVADWHENIGSQYELEDLDDNAEDAQLSNKRYREFDASVVGSRDRFTSRRSYEWKEPFSRPDNFPPVPFDWETHKYGGSEFLRTVDDSDNKYRWDWAGMDTSSLYIRGCFIEFDPEPKIKCSNYSPDVPWGWGGAHALDQSAGDETFNDYGFEGAVPERRSYRGRSSKNLWGTGAWINEIGSGILLTSYEPNAYSGDHVQHKLTNIDGLREFYDFREDGSEAFQYDLGPAIFSLYIKESSDMGKQRALIEGRGGRIAEDFDTEKRGGLIEDRIGAVAKAQPYFSRPTDLSGWARADQQFEHGNLYNPFWQARLVELSDEEKLTASAIVVGSNPR